jgi:hypothetical protein
VEIADDGKVLTIDSQPWLIGKVFAVLFALLSAVMPLILVLSLVVPPSRGSIDCDRARGTCRVANAAWKKELPIGDIAAAKLVFDRGARNRSSSHDLVLNLRNGPDLSVSDRVYRPELADAMSQAVVGLNRFLLDPAAPSFHAEYISSDTDWAAGIPMTLFSLLACWIFWRLWVSRRVAIDRGARTLRLQVRPKLRAPVDETFDWGEVTGLSAAGNNWATLMMNTKRGAFALLLLPRGGTQLREVVDKLTQILNVPFNASEQFKKRWNL